MDYSFFIALAGILWVDLLLSGDNAIVIALVCRKLPAPQQRLGMILGASAAIGLRVVMSFFVAALLSIYGLSVIGGLFLLYVASKLALQAEENLDDTKSSASLWAAVGTIALADAGMSFDNVMALAGLAHGNVLLMALGVVMSIPLVIFGSAVIGAVIDRFPALVWAGAALLGWVAGGIIVTDRAVTDLFLYPPHAFDTAASVLGAAIVLTVGCIGLALKDARAEVREALHD